MQPEYSLFVELLDALCAEWSAETGSDVRKDLNKVRLLRVASEQIADSTDLAEETVKFYQEVFLRDVWDRNHTRTTEAGPRGP